MRVMWAADRAGLRKQLRGLAGLCGTVPDRTLPGPARARSTHAPIPPPAAVPAPLPPPPEHMQPPPPHTHVHKSARRRPSPLVPFQHTYKPTHPPARPQLQTLTDPILAYTYQYPIVTTMGELPRRGRATDTVRLRCDVWEGGKASFAKAYQLARCHTKADISA